MYEFFITSSAKKDFKKITRKTQKIIRKVYVTEILKNPNVGEKLKGKEFKDLLKLKFSVDTTEYRIIYKVEKKELVVIFIMFGARENFYKKLKNRI